MSSIGIANNNNGIINDVSVNVLNPINIIIEIISPINVEPASPIYILAGGKLCTKYPKVAPNIIIEIIISKPPNLFNINPIIAVVRK